MNNLFRKLYLTKLVLGVVAVLLACVGGAVKAYIALLQAGAI